MDALKPLAIEMKRWLFEDAPAPMGDDPGWTPPPAVSRS